MQNLPTDLIRPIFQQIHDRGTLLSLCLSSKFFRTEAQRILYRSPLGVVPSPSQHIRFLTSVLNHPRLALLIKVYHVMLISGSDKVAFWRLLPPVLSIMTNLKVFSISALGKDLKLLPMDQLVFQLEVLSWIQIDGGDLQPFVRWLDTQQALKELRWICKSPIAVSPVACPNLLGLEGKFRAINALLPNRHVKRLYWLSDAMFQGCHLASFLTDLRSDLGSIESLTFERHTSTIDYRLLVDRLPSLTSLEFIGDGKEFVDDIPVPSGIKVLILSIQKGYGMQTSFPMTVRSALVEKLFTQSPSLVRVDVAAQLIGSKVFYTRWEYGTRIGLVSSRDVLQGRRMVMDEY